MNTKLIAISATLLTMLAGCGGGGGGGSTSSTPAAGTTSPTGSGGTSGTTTGGSGGTTTTSTGTGLSVPIEQAMITLYTSGKTFNRTNVIGADTYVVMAAYTNTGAGNFEGTATTKTEVTRNVTKNGSPFFSSDQTDYFEGAPAFKIDGRILNSQSPNTPAANYFVTSATGFVKLPATGKPGDSGTFYNADIYISQTNKTKVGTATQNWTVAPDTDTTDIFCINSTYTIGANSSTQQDCYKIDAQGNVPSVLFSTPSTTQL